MALRSRSGQEAMRLVMLGAWEPGTLVGTFQKAAGARERAANGDMVDQGQVSRQGSGSGGRPRGQVPTSRGQVPCHLSAWLPCEETEPGSPEVSRGVAGWWVGFVLEAWVRLLIF